MKSLITSNCSPTQNTRNPSPKSHKSPSSPLWLPPEWPQTATANPTPDVSRHIYGFVQARCLGLKNRSNQSTINIHIRPAGIAFNFKLILVQFLKRRVQIWAARVFFAFAFQVLFKLFEFCPKLSFYHWLIAFDWGKLHKKP